ncbi:MULTISPECIES: MarR family winged helix-turn-helix transcriptional regulator [unclassified Amycolatopsis]|uniref:MarR family winged helix-turn-helix transcriptional regulator n=1 Tax=unclassified Amycolatopsis TaxID=2618356 RepID=UPI001FF4CD06|nr:MULTISPECIES: helix-turn-helix domain-containing protein [unclassified Amycolatopsis]UOZ09294.1 MarR family winged helix-turn-helix transcriptional regulator [Amycolatopsis sp. WQ 127309]
MAMTSGPDGLGTRLRHVLELLDGDVAKFLGDIGLDGYRPRYSPVVRALLAKGPLAIRDLAAELRVTHSAASQTVAQMSRAGLVTLEPGADARQRIISLTDRARDVLPLVEAEWAATNEAWDALEAELPHSLRALLDAIVEALDRKPFRERIGETEAARELL